MRTLVYGLSANKLAGIETFLLNMNAYMNDCLFDYVVEGRGSIHAAHIREHGGKLICIAPKKNAVRNILDWLRVLRKGKVKYATVYFNLYSLAWIAPILLCRWMGYRVVVHSHNNMLHNCGRAYRLVHRIHRKLLKHLNVVRLTNSTLSSEFMFGSAMVGKMIYNAICVDRFMFNTETRARIRSSLHLRDRHVYGFVGRIEYQKNPQFLIEIFGEIAKRDPSATLMVLGEGDQADDIKRTITRKGLEDHVLMLGRRKNAEEYYQAMDVFLLPSRFEGLGLVLIEAQTAGLPSMTSQGVVPRCAGVTELLEFVPLTKPAGEWAGRAIDLCQKTLDRGKYAEIVRQSRYNIEREALLLEQVLAGE